MKATDNKKCGNCIHYNKISKRSGYCETNVMKIFIEPLFDKKGKELKFHINTLASNYCSLHEILPKE